MRLVIGITGASGAVYAKHVLQQLKHTDVELHVIITDNGRNVFRYELDRDFQDFIVGFDNITLYSNDNMFSAVASGSFKTEGMIVIPSSMATVGKIAGGISDTLLCRAADVALKERRKLVVCPRETPFSNIHLENMLKLSRENAIIFPLFPPFYAKLATIEEAVDRSIARVLDIFGIQSKDYYEWS